VISGERTVNPKEPEPSLIDKFELLGVKLRISRTGQLWVTPAFNWAEVQELIDSMREEIVEALLREGRWADPLLDDVLAAKKLSPIIWSPGRLVDGRVVRIWAVTPRGVIVSVGPGAALITVKPSELVCP